MALLVRPIEPGDELARAWEIGRLAFGVSARPGEPRVDSSVLPEGQLWYGAFERSGQLIGMARELFHDQWWGGRLVPAADVSSVAVLPESRARGAARALMTGLLAHAYERGAAVSALYPTASPVYRAFGWANCGALRTVQLPTAMLAAPRYGSGVTVRPADPAGGDRHAIAQLYTKVARLRDGLLSRAAQARPATGYPEGIDGITLIEQDGMLTGYASWIRGSGYRTEAVLEVADLFATTLEAARELIAVIAGWRSVTPTVQVKLLDLDPFSVLLPLETATKLDARPWMHRPVDVARAISARGWPAARRGTVTFVLHDGVAAWNDGAWRLEVAGGEASLVRTASAPDLHLDVAGFALLYTGVATPAMLRESGLLTGPLEQIDGLELLAPAVAAQLLDYF